ncbi:uncharacterized protein HKW66_Vig0134490 [Vigna angularis]|uniref:Uncharacterized protein n=1 Tax=Phaseolus angularis TaxID=3914 RepID=A0A8T0K157_PHAAN|nr:uncharacterized protein HKW66_Vig0134490 [Vigna angularis]
MYGNGRRNEEHDQGMRFSPNLTFLLLFHFFKATQRNVEISVTLTCVVPILHATSSIHHCPSNRCHCLVHHLAHQLQTSPLRFRFGTSPFKLQLPPSLHLLCISPNQTNPKNQIKFKTHFSSHFSPNQGLPFSTLSLTHQTKTSPCACSFQLLRHCVSSCRYCYRTLQHSRRRHVCR